MYPCECELSTKLTRKLSVCTLLNRKKSHFYEHSKYAVASESRVLEDLIVQMRHGPVSNLHPAPWKAPINVSPPPNLPQKPC